MGMARRLAAILAADLVGYSRLIREDEAGTLAALKFHLDELIEPKVAERNGRIVKLMGDGLLAEFPSAVEAVQCAVEIQHLVGAGSAEVPEDKRAIYRIGINIGDIIVEGDDIYGDGVNVAARLEGLAEPGGICIARNVFDEVKDKLNLTIEHLGGREVKNIAEPVTVYRVILDEKAAISVTPVVRKAAKRTSRRWVTTVAAAVILLAAAGGALWWQPWAHVVESASIERMAFPLPEKPSIAVLPFDNLSGDIDQQYFADGITEDIITALSRFHDLFVIARNSTFAYKDKPVKVQKVAEDLGVRYVLEGSVRKVDQSLRINVQLIDALSGRNVWAESYDREASASLQLQNDIVRAIVTAMAVKVEEVERQELIRATPNSFRAYDYFLRGRDLQVRKGFWVQDINQEVRQLQEAWTHLYDFLFGWTDPSGPSLDRALELAHKAVSLDPSSARAHYILGYVYLYNKEHDLAAAEVDKALTLNPNEANLRAGMAGLQIYGGNPRAAIVQLRDAMRHNPHHPDWYWHFLGWAQYHAAQYDEVIEALKRVASPSAGDHRVLAATYARLGRLDEARKHAAEVLEQEPKFNLSYFRTSLPYRNKADLDNYIDALRKAGLPE
jgi:adenylate cyclase